MVRIIKLYLGTKAILYSLEFKLLNLDQDYQWREEVSNNKMLICSKDHMEVDHKANLIKVQ